MTKPIHEAWAPRAERVERDSLLSPEPEAPIRTSHHALVLLPGMEAMIRGIVRDVDAATRRVLVETYIVRADKLGHMFGEVLVRAAGRGVEVRLLYDPLGSQKTDPAFFDDLTARGVQTRAYRPTDVVLQSGRYGPRDHARAIVIDDAAYTGGAAWGDEWLPRWRGGQGWHDVCLRVEGPGVRDFAHVFEQRWLEAVGAIARPRDFVTGDRYPDLELVFDSPRGRPHVLDRHCARIERARERVWLENAYFFPPAEMLRALYQAAARGVDVRVIVPADSDLYLVAGAARAEYAEWLAHGVKMFEYTRCMLHSKFAVIDDDWSTVGTFNANPPGVGWANEANAFVFDRAFVARVARLFESDLARCRAVTAAMAGDRPLLQRTRDHLARDLMALLDVARASAR